MSSASLVDSGNGHMIYGLYIDPAWPSHIKLPAILGPGSLSSTASCLPEVKYQNGTISSVLSSDNNGRMITTDIQVPRTAVQ